MRSSPCLTDWDTAGGYNWASGVLAFLYRHLCEACPQSSPSASVGGCVYLLQLWMWSRLPDGWPVVEAPREWFRSRQPATPTDGCPSLGLGESPLQQDCTCLRAVRQRAGHTNARDGESTSFVIVYYEWTITVLTYALDGFFCRLIGSHTTTYRWCCLELSSCAVRTKTCTRWCVRWSASMWLSITFPIELHANLAWLRSGQSSSSRPTWSCTSKCHYVLFTWVLEILV
jgi:hypothetical protein